MEKPLVTVTVPLFVSYREIIGADTLGLDQGTLPCPFTTLYRSKGS